MSFVGRHISSLPTPALIVDKEKVICETPSFPADLFFGTLSLCPLHNTFKSDMNKNLLVWGQLSKDARSRCNEQDLSSSSDQNPQDGRGRRPTGIIRVPPKYYLRRLVAREGRSSPRPWWSARCTRTQGSRTSSMGFPTSLRIRNAPGSSDRGWRSSISWYDGWGGMSNVALTKMSI